jgi:hypothetical protein
MIRHGVLYNGIVYRSRQEAKYAAFWELLGWKFTYEPFEGNGYIPDFLIDGDNPLLVEVKTAHTKEQYEREVPKIVKGLKNRWEHDFLIVGFNPIAQWQSPAWEDGLCAGLLSDKAWGSEVDDGIWFRCKECGGVGVYHSTGHYGGRPCGHSDGDHHLGHLDEDFIRDGWARATNVTQWRPGEPRYFRRQEQ